MKKAPGEIDPAIFDRLLAAPPAEFTATRKEVKQFRGKGGI